MRIKNCSLFKKIISFLLVFIMILSSCPLYYNYVKAADDMPTETFKVLVTDNEDNKIENATVSLEDSNKVIESMTSATNEEGIADFPKLNDYKSDSELTLNYKVSKEDYVEKSGTIDFKTINWSDSYNIKIEKTTEVTRTDRSDFKFDTENPEDLNYYDNLTYTNVATSSMEPQKVTYSSSDGKVGEVNEDGKVELKKVGTVTITATMHESDNYNESKIFYNLTVKKSDRSDFKFDTENPEDLSYSHNLTYTNVATSLMEPKKVTYSSSDEDVGQVNEDGKVELKKVGTVTITATMPESDNYRQSKISYKLTVKKADIKPFDFAISDPADITYDKSSNEFDNSIEKYSGGVNYTIISQTRDGKDVGNVATIDNSSGKLTIQSSGEVTVKAKSEKDPENYNNSEATYSLKIKRANQSGFAFNETSPDSIAYGQSFTNIASGGQGNGEITYTVVNGNENVEKSEDGSIKGIGIGEATIRADKKADDCYEAISTEYRISVTKANQADFKFDNDNYQSNYGISGLNIKASGGQTDGKVTYSICDDPQNICEIDEDSGSLTFKDGARGTATIKANKLGDEHYNDIECSTKVTVDYYNQTSSYTVSGTKGENGWYKSDVLILPPEGYKISKSDSFSSEWSDNITLKESSDEFKVYFRKSTGENYGAITSSIDVGKIKIDQNVPTKLNVEYSVNAIKKIINDIFYWWYKDYVDVTFSAEDSNSGLDYAEYIKSDGTIKKINFKNGESKVVDHITEETEHFVNFSFSATDKAGNKEKLTDNKYKILIDKTSPKISVKYDSTNRGNVYNKVRTATITIKEANFDKEKVNLNLNKCEIDSNDLTPVKKTLDFVDSGDEHTATLIFEDNANYQFDISCTDQSGNVSEPYNSEKFEINKTVPTATITYDNKTAINGIYYNKKRTATIIITDKMFDPQRVITTISAVKNKNDNGKSSKEVNKAFIDKTSLMLSQEDKWKALDQDRHEAQIEFSDDDDYTFKLTYTNEVGTNLSNDINEHFVIDSNAPQVISKIKYDVTWQKASTLWYCRNQKVNCAITAFDDTSLIEEISYHVKQYDNNGNSIGNSKEICIYNNQNNDSAIVNQLFEINYEFKGNLEFTIKDKAGNKFNYQEDGILVKSKEKPVIELNYDDGGNGKYYSTNRTATVKITDKYINKNNIIIKVKKDAKDYFDQNYNKIKVSESKNNNGLVTLSYSIPFTEEGKYDLSINCFDQTAQTTEKNDEFIVDKTHPVVKVKADNSPVNGLYNSDVTCSVSCSDINGGVTTSNIKSLSYKIINMGVVTKEGQLIKDNEQGLKSNYNGKITIPAKLNNSNDVRVEVQAIDMAGNHGEDKEELAIDCTKPKISVFFSNNSAQNSVIFKEDRKATITVTERNFDQSKVKTSILSNLRSYTVLNWVKVSGTGNGDNTKWIGEIYFTDDADYSFNISCNDNALNSNYPIEYSNGTVAANKFIIDKTKPVITVNYDNNSSQNTIYYKDSRTATIQVLEHNFNSSDVKINLTASADTEISRIPQISAWTSDGDKHVSTIAYQNDGTYTFSMNYTDKAGNVGNQIDSQSFTIDKTKPTIEVSGVEENHAYNDNLKPQISISDKNIDTGKTSVELSGAERGKVDLSNTYSDSLNSRLYVLDVFQKVKNIDDVYTLKISVTDRSGNLSEQTIKFSVNRFGSTYDIDENSQSIMGNFVKQTEDIVFYEYNVDNLKNIKVTLYKNNQTIELKEGIDYIVVGSGNNDEWCKYTYTFFKKLFVDDGTYKIVVKSEDEAGNLAENTLDSKNTSISFGIDTTLPTLVVINLENNKLYAVDKLDVKFKSSDNLELDTINVNLDGKKIKTWSKEDIQSIESKAEDYDFVINGNSTSAHNVTFECIDAAGNKFSKTLNGFYVTTNKWVSFYNNKALFFGSIGAIILLIGFVVFIICFKKKSKKA